MVRKGLGFAFALLLFVALGLAIAHAYTHSVRAASAGFSAPCEPASPAFKAADQSKAISRIDSNVSAEAGEAPGGVMRITRSGAAPQTIPPPAPGTFPPLFHRPPPANS